MKTKFDIDDNLLISAIEREYKLSITDIAFLPKGDSAYCYTIKCFDNRAYFLKLYDNNTDGGKSRIKNLGTYLSLTHEMYDRQLFKHLTYPYKNNSGNYSTDLGFATVILFNFIHGRTLEDAYPFTLALEKEIACTLAKVHSTTPYLDLSKSQVENFELPYVEKLKEYLSYLDSFIKHSNIHIEILRDYILPRKNIILDFLNELLKYQKQAKQLLHEGKIEMVVSHGDVWGGNLIIDEYDNMHLIDWESTIIAPAERDVRNYTGDHFGCFLEEYEKQLDIKINLYTDIFGYYMHYFHLANLTNWIQRILCENKSSEQNESDMDCIMNHCMNRWANIENTLKNIDYILKKRDKQIQIF